MATETTVHYALDTRSSQFTVQVFSGGLLSSFGHNPTMAIRDFSGDTELNADDPEKASLKVTVRAESLEVKDDISDKDRREIERTMHENILEVSEYPEIVYECSKMAAAKVGEGQFTVTLNGDLTMHGTTHSLSIPARVSLDGDVLRSFGTFSLCQTDFGLRLASVAGGALKVKDELKFSFNVVGRKKE